MSNHYDAVILGAGINGVAIAKALAQDGRSVCVIDKATIGCGASSHSSRLIHGGLRYLEHFEFALVKEALQDQHYLLENYPEILTLRPFYLPHYQHSRRAKWMIKIGLWLYGLFGQHHDKPSEVDTQSFASRFPAMKQQGLNYVYCYYDAQTDDLLLTKRIAWEAQNAGAVFKLNRKVHAIDMTGEYLQLSFGSTLIETPLLINATGAWIDEVNTTFHLPSRYSIEKLSGIHIVLNGLLVPEPLILETQTQRIIFILPQKDTTLIGTTERVETSNIDDVSVHEADVNYLIKEANNYLETPLTREDVIDTFIGVRPIIKTKKDPSKMSREYKLDIHKIRNNHLMHIYGGKLTTFHSLAQKALQRIKDVQQTTD